MRGVIGPTGPDQTLMMQLRHMCQLLSQRPHAYQHLAPFTEPAGPAVGDVAARRGGGHPVPRLQHSRTAGGGAVCFLSFSSVFLFVSVNVSL